MNNTTHSRSKHAIRIDGASAPNALAPLQTMTFVIDPVHDASYNEPNYWYGCNHTNSYDYARMMGGLYADEFADYLENNPGCVGQNLFGLIAGDMNHADVSDAKGYIDGFFTRLETLIAVGAKAMGAVHYGTFEKEARHA